jgi:hypothetical protein
MTSGTSKFFLKMSRRSYIDSKITTQEVVLRARPLGRIMINS